MFNHKNAFSSFSVKDLKQAKQFYTEILEMEVSEDKYTMQLHLENGQRIMVYPKDNHTPASFTVLNFPVDNIEKAVEILKAKGVSFEVYKYPGLTTDEDGIFRGEGPFIGWFKDPSGNILSIMEEK